MSSLNKHTHHEHDETNESNVSRYKHKDRKRAAADTRREEENSTTNAKRRKRMDYSTPVRGETGEMMRDGDLVSPIPPFADVLADNSSLVSDGGNGMGPIEQICLINSDT